MTLVLNYTLLEWDSGVPSSKIPVLLVVTQQNFTNINLTCQGMLIDDVSQEVIVKADLPEDNGG